MMRILATIVLAFFLALPARAGQTLSFGYIGAPLSYSSLAVLKAAYARLGIDIKGIRLPAARALAQSDAGLTDGEVHRIKAIAPQHPQLLLVDVPINTVEAMAVSCNQPVDTSSLAAISGRRIGVKVGTLYAERLTKGMPNVTRMPSEAMLMELLLAHRLDVVIGDRPWALTQLAGVDHECVRINEPPLMSIPVYHYLNVRHAALVPDIRRVLQEMKDSGEMDGIVRSALAAAIGDDPAAE
jgi:polar amino acid transport system substrate-binding protein